MPLHLEFANHHLPTECPNLQAPLVDLISQCFILDPLLSTIKCLWATFVHFHTGLTTSSMLIQLNTNSLQHMPLCSSNNTSAHTIKYAHQTQTQTATSYSWQDNTLIQPNNNNKIHNLNDNTIATIYVAFDCYKNTWYPQLNIPATHR